MPPQARIDPLLPEKVLSSPPFARSERICDYLRLLADQTNRADRLKDVEIGARTARRVSQMGRPLTGSSRWSPHGTMLALDPRALTSEASNEAVPGWSRDGKYIHYSSDRAGAWSVWRKLAGGGAAELVRDRAFAGAESPDGRYLYYVHGPNDAGLYREPLSGGDEETARARGWKHGLNTAPSPPRPAVCFACSSR